PLAAQKHVEHWVLLAEFDRPLGDPPADGGLVRVSCHWVVLDGATEPPEPPDPGDKREHNGRRHLVEEFLVVAVPPNPRPTDVHACHGLPPAKISTHVPVCDHRQLTSRPRPRHPSMMVNSGLSGSS